LRIGSYLAAHGRDRSVSSGGTATGGRATPAAGAAIGGVADLSRKGGHLPFDFFRAALRAVNGQLLVPTPEENLETSPTFPASEFKNRHQHISSDETHPGPSLVGRRFVLPSSRGEIRRNTGKCQDRSAQTNSLIVAAEVAATVAAVQNRIRERIATLVLTRAGRRERYAKIFKKPILPHRSG